MQASSERNHFTKPGLSLPSHGQNIKVAKLTAQLQPSVEPTALFWGVVDSRMEAEWLLALADALSKEKIVLAGPQQDPDPRVMQHTKIEGIGPVAMAELPKMAAAANVLIMPYADLPVTRAMQPLKFKEYIATGRPVVTSNLPAVKPWAEYVKTANTKAEFIESTIRHLQSFETKSHASDNLHLRLQNETWEQKSRLFEDMMAI